MAKRPSYRHVCLTTSDKFEISILFPGNGHFAEDYQILIVDCAWWDHNDAQSNTCNYGKWYVNEGENFQPDFLILPVSTLVIF